MTETLEQTRGRVLTRFDNGFQDVLREAKRQQVQEATTRIIRRDDNRVIGSARARAMFHNPPACLDDSPGNDNAFWLMLLCVIGCAFFFISMIGWVLLQVI